VVVAAAAGRNAIGDGDPAAEEKAIDAEAAAAATVMTRRAPTEGRMGCCPVCGVWMVWLEMLVTQMAACKCGSIARTRTSIAVVYGWCGWRCQSLKWLPVDVVQSHAHAHTSISSQRFLGDEKT